MQAEPWRWDSGAGEAPLWQKVLTLAHDYGEPIIRLAQIPGSFVPGVDKALDRLAALTALYSADLNISALDGPHAFKALDGAPPPVTAKSGDGPVFFDGVEARVTVSHNAKGKESILLERIDLTTIAFVPGHDSYFDYRLEGEAIIGAGQVEPMRFFVELDARGPRPARRQVRAPDGTKTMLIAQGPNFLDTDPESYWSFSASEPPLPLRFTLTPLDAGYYEACFRFFYRVAARELRQHTTAPIRLYTRGL